MRRRLNKTNRVCSVGNLAGLYHCASKTDGSLGDERVKMAGVCDGDGVGEGGGC